MPPLVSIIIPHYARPALLREAVASVMASSEQRFEIIIVDDGSSDADWRDVQQVAEPRIRVFQRTDGIKGPSRCRNLGLAETKGDYVLFLDSDDLLSPWCLEERLKQAIQTPEADLWVFPVLLFKDVPGDVDLLWNAMVVERGGQCGSSCQCWNGMEEWQRAGCPRHGGPGILPGAITINATDGSSTVMRDAAERFACSDPPWHTSSALWKRDALLQLGGFNEAVFYGDDSDLHLRALVNGLNPRLYPDALPDAFVRRSDAPRITNSLSSALIESRRIRLREGTRFLRAIPQSGESRHLVGGVRHPAEHSSPQSRERGPLLDQASVTAIEPARLLALWEGQYFVEAEFLLFNHSPANESVARVLGDWEMEFFPGTFRRMVVRAYFALALASRHHAYMVLRLARRTAMKILPADYFPRGGQYHSARADATIMAILMERLSMNPDAPDSFGT